VNEQVVDRGQERSEVGAFLAGAQAGGPSLLLIAGEAGVGKSTLIRAVLREHGLDGAEGAGRQDGTAPYGPVAEVLRRLHASRRSHLRGPLRAQLAGLLPELGEAAEDGDRGTLQEAIRAFLAMAAGERPVIIVVDDLQWADHATLELLPSLARSLDPDAVAILAAYRSDELPRSHPIRRMRAQLRRGGRLRELTVEPFDASRTTELLAATIGAEPAPSLTAAVFDRTDGVPFFVQELGTALTARDRLRPGPRGLELQEGQDLPLPENVRDAVMLQAAALSDDARAAAMAAAAAGPELPIALLCEAAGLPAWPDELVRCGLMVEVAPEHAAFRHALIRDAFMSEIPWTRRIELHRAAARSLETYVAPALVVAEQWAKAREPERAVPEFVKAADEFHKVHAHRDAALAARRALELWPDAAVTVGGIERVDVLERLAVSAELGGDLGDAVAAWRDAADLREAFGDHAGLAAVRSRLASAFELQGRWEEALAWREGSASAFDAAGLPAEAAAERLAAAAHLRSAARFRAALAVLETAGRDARAAARLDLQARILGLEGNVRARMGESARGVELVRTALGTALDHGLTGPAGEIYQRLADSLEHAGEYPSARDTYDEAFAYCETNALGPSAQLCRACLTVVLRTLGDWDRAAALCRDVIAANESTVHARAVATGTLGFILGVRGQSRRARSLLVESASFARRIELAAMELLSAWGLALIDDAIGAPERAADRCSSILDRWNDTEERHYAIGALRWGATFFAETGQADATRACIAALGTIAAAAPRDEALSAFSHGLGEAALLDGDHELAAKHFVQALDHLRALGAPYERMMSERRAGHALLRGGRAEEAVGRLVAAHRLARRLKAAPFAERVAGELAALGEKADPRSSRRTPRGGPAGLTRRETEVIRLVAVGRTNREIAKELFLSPRTVDMHVQNILFKLDCRSRADAARRATELGLLTESRGS
jgi:DNA-binding CsgD family transcriptional regulator